MDKISILKRAADNGNTPILDRGNGVVPNTYFNLIRLRRNQSFSYRLEQHESVAVVLRGCCDIQAGKTYYPAVGQRKDIWSGKADSVYAGVGTHVFITALEEDTEIAVAGGVCHTVYDSFRIFPSEVEVVEVGSEETKSHRFIHYILGNNAHGRAGNLLVSELYCADGCWSGYPPHKHDEEKMPDESAFEETYHYRFYPENGFGAQFCYMDNSEPEVKMTRNGDTFSFRKGYHPTVTSPGHREYIFTILVGAAQRSLVQNFEEKYRYLMQAIPGIHEMVNAFK